MSHTDEGIVDIEVINSEDQDTTRTVGEFAAAVHFDEVDESCTVSSDVLRNGREHEDRREDTVQAVLEAREPTAHHRV